MLVWSVVPLRLSMMMPVVPVEVPSNVLWLNLKPVPLYGGPLNDGNPLVISKDSTHPAPVAPLAGHPEAAARNNLSVVPDLSSVSGEHVVEPVASAFGAPDTGEVFIVPAVGLLVNPNA
jgi:hypothetical protein